MGRDIIDLLLADHEELRRRFDGLEEATQDERPERFRATVALLAGHEAAEEALVHRALREEVPDGADVAEEVLTEEAQAEELLAQMEEMDPASDRFTDAMLQLKHEVLAHAEHEEREEFPRLRDALSAERRGELGERFERLRDVGPTHPHPETPQSPGVRAVAGPFVGMFDRARDAARSALRD